MRGACRRYRSPHLISGCLRNYGLHARHRRHLRIRALRFCQSHHDTIHSEPHDVCRNSKSQSVLLVDIMLCKHHRSYDLIGAHLHRQASRGTADVGGLSIFSHVPGFWCSWSGA